MKRGFSVVEIIIAVAVFGIVSIAAITTSLQTLSTNRLSDEYARGSYLATEGVEAARSIREQNWANLVAGTYGVASISGKWQFSGSNNALGKFNRTVAVSAVNRNAGAIVTTGGSVDANTMKVDSTVSWNFTPLRTNTITQSTYLTYFDKAIAVSWAAPTLESNIPLAGNGNGIKVQTVGNYVYLVSSLATPNFNIYNISNPASPTLAGSLTLTGTPTNIFVLGNYAYVTTNSGTAELQIVNITTPTAPTLSSAFDIAGTTTVTNSVYVVGTIAYVVKTAGGGNEFFVINVATPTAPVVLGSVNYAQTLYDVYVLGNYAYVGTANTAGELIVFNITTPSAPAIVATLNLPNSNFGISIAGFGAYVFLGRNAGPLNIISIATPTAPSLVGTYTTTFNVNDVDVDPTNNLVFIASADTAAEMMVISVATPATPSRVGFYGATNVLNGVAYNSTLSRVIGAMVNTTNEFIIIKP